MIIDNNTRCLIIHPIAVVLNREEEMLAILKKHGVIISETTIQLSWRGFDNLIKECYRGDRWTGGIFAPKSWKKAKKCYIENSFVRVFVIKFNNPAEIVDIKQKIRNVYDLEKHSLHITDTIEDTFRIYKTTFNKNSIHYLNNGCCLSENSQQILLKYFHEILTKNPNNFCVTSSFILEMYGIRDANDLDYIHLTDLNLNLEKINPHTNKWLKFYSKTKDEIINDDENHFYFNGFKFASLSVILTMKKNRNEKKDKEDLELCRKIIL